MTKTAFRDPFNDPQDPQKGIWAAKTAIKEYVDDEVEQGNLAAIEKDMDTVVTNVAISLLAKPSLYRTINRAMIERWVMGAITSASHAQSRAN